MFLCSADLTQEECRRVRAQLREAESRCRGLQDHVEEARARERRISGDAEDARRRAAAEAGELCSYMSLWRLVHCLRSTDPLQIQPLSPETYRHSPAQVLCIGFFFFFFPDLMWICRAARLMRSHCFVKLLPLFHACLTTLPPSPHPPPPAPWTGRYAGGDGVCHWYLGYHPSNVSLGNDVPSLHEI